MATKKQIEANRRNAKKSTGPKTPEGKATVAGNALKHGLTSRQVVLADEDPEEFVALVRQLERELAPQGTLERLMVRRLAGVQWRLARVPALEAEILDRLRIDPVGFDNGLGRAWERDGAPDGGALSRLARYEASLDRSAARLLRELRRLQQHRMEQERHALERLRERNQARARGEPVPPEEAGPAPGQSIADWWNEGLQNKADPGAGGLVERNGKPVDPASRAQVSRRGSEEDRARGEGMDGGGTGRKPLPV
jgi:hypothetical protein